MHLIQYFDCFVYNDDDDDNLIYNDDINDTINDDIIIFKPLITIFSSQYFIMPF